MNIPELYKIYLKHPIICTDSRKLIDNSIFFALKGSNFNGNKFAEKALEKCAYAVIDEIEYKKDDRFILVDDALQAMQKLAYFHRMQLDIPILGITGSNGKTTTKELISNVLAEKYKIFATQGNLNNHIGVPLTILSMDNSIEIGIVEMGANHIGDINELCEIAQPNFGIITNVGKAHLEGFGSFEGVKEAKGELYDFLYKNDGLAFINSDNEHLDEMNPPHKTITYGTSKFTHVQGEMMESEWNVKIRWFAQTVQDDEDDLDDDQEVDDEHNIINTKLYGQYNFENVLTAVCVGHYFAIDNALIKRAIESYIPTNNRSQLVEKGSNKIILDAYNANPASMKIALENFLGLNETSSKLAILGDMLELGRDAILEHSNILYYLEEFNFSNVILVGKLFKESAFDFDFPIFENVDDCKKYLKERPFHNHLILIKASRGIKLEEVVDAL